MKRSPKRSLWFVRSACLLLVLGVAVSNSAQAEVRSIQEFMVFQKKWANFVATEYEWKLEGRYSGISDGTLTFTKCPLPFLVTEAQVRQRGSTGTIEVSGQLVLEKKGLAFRVKTLTPRPRDVDRLKAMRFAIDSTKADEWYATADWARNRGTFYGDKDLLAAARDLDRNGVLTELRQLKPGDEKGFRDLIQKARVKGLDKSVLQRMMHDALQARAVNLRNRPFSDAAYRDLIVQIRKDLQGAGDPLKAFPAELNDRYLAKPETVYAAASAEERRVLSRLFAVEMMTERILNGALPDGSNGFAIAEQLRKEVPERIDLIQKYEELEVTDRLRKIDVLTRTQLLELCKWLESHDRIADATDAKKKWLTAREPAYRQDGARGLADLAQQWMSLLKDKSAAAQLYIDALHENPQYSPATEWLMAHGYRPFEKTWLPEEEIRNMPLTPRQQAIRDGRVEIGMTASEVQATLGAVPTSITRIASRTQITEWWVYQESRVILEFVKSRREQESLVVKIDSLPDQEKKTSNDGVD